MNDLEVRYIAEEKTLFPNGYNLDEGGKKKSSLRESREKIMLNIQNLYLEPKLDKFKDVKGVKVEDADKYIKEWTSHGEIYYAVIIDNVKSIFVGKYMTKEELRQRALDFVTLLANRDSATSSNCGNPLTASSTIP